jgi:hypothetical protein
VQGLGRDEVGEHARREHEVEGVVVVREAVVDAVSVPAGL